VEATRLLSLVTMIFSIGPAIAPVLGGWIVKLLDWRSIFLLLFGYTVALGWYCYRHLPETLPVENRTPFHARTLAREYWRVMTSPLFQLRAGTVAFSFAGLFLYVGAAPVFITRHLGLGPESFAWQFIPAVGGILLGALAANRLAGRISVARQVAIAFVFMLSAGFGNVLYHLFLPPALPWSVLPLFVFTFGMSLLTPVVTLLILDLFPRTRGLVASCQSFTQTMLGAVVAGLVAPILDESVLWLAAGQLVFATIALALWVTGYTYNLAQERRKMNAWETVPTE
jgi:DHA1 family bicyclomycin/chloramphenicol resistance-like MFS transporter